MKSTQPISRDSGFLQIHALFSGELEFPAAWISPQSERSHGPPLVVTPAEVLGRIVLSELPLEEFVFPDVDEVAKTAGRSEGRRAPIAWPTEFAISLKA
jgi:hypothetical protein